MTLRISLLSNSHSHPSPWNFVGYPIHYIEPSHPISLIGPSYQYSPFWIFCFIFVLFFVHLICLTASPSSVFHTLFLNSANKLSSFLFHHSLRLAIWYNPPVNICPSSDHPFTSPRNFHCTSVPLLFVPYLALENLVSLLSLFLLPTIIYILTDSIVSSGYYSLCWDSSQSALTVQSLHTGF
jgi:hypothetical protein